MTEKRGKGIIENIEKEVKRHTAWQEKHAKDDDLQFKKITTSLAALPNKDDFEKVLGGIIDIKINGKLIGLKDHLDEQDRILEAAAVERASTQQVLVELRNQVRPLNSARTWATEFGKVITYVGGLAAAVAAIVFFLSMIGLHISQ